VARRAAVSTLLILLSRPAHSRLRSPVARFRRSSAVT
jgi:hypothetical protein